MNRCKKCKVVIKSGVICPACRSSAATDRAEAKRAKICGTPAAPQWNEFTFNRRNAVLPKEKKFVLVLIRHFTDDGKAFDPCFRATAAVVGYLKFAAGDPDSPYFVCHSVKGNWRPIAWCDCLPENFDRQFRSDLEKELH